MSRFKRPELESSIEDKCRRIAEKNGGKLVKLLSPGNSGMTDRLLVMPKIRRGGGLVPVGFGAFIEFKRPGKQLGELQGYWRDLLLNAGFEVWKCDSVQWFQFELKRMGYDR